MQVTRFTSEPPVPRLNLSAVGPQRCPQCDLAGRIKADATIQTGTVQRTWYCYGCGFEWPRA
jgi:hypothetical protein